MSYVEKNLIAGETVVYATGLHWIVLLWPVVLGLIFGVPGLALLARYASSSGDKSASSIAMAVGGLILLVAAVVCIGTGILKRNATEMAVTDKRVILKRGFLARRTFELLLRQVESISVNEPAMGRILGYGTVVVDGTGGSLEPFDTVARPIEFRKQVQQQIEKTLERSR